MDTIERCIEFCTSIEPTFAGRIRGADGASIQEIERLMGRPMGALHRAFLERLGETEGGMGTDIYAPDVHALLATYPGIEGLPPAGIELFAAGVEENDEDLFLVERDSAPSATSNPSPAVMSHPSLYGRRWSGLATGRLRMEASSIEEFLCTALLRFGRVADRAVRLGYDQREYAEGTLARFAEIVANMGFERRWFSGEIVHAVVRGEIDIIGVQRPGDPFSLEISGTEPGPTKETAAALASAMHLTAYDV